MARPQVAGGGDGLQVRNVATSILNKQSRKPTKGGPPALVSGVRLTTPHLKNISLLQNVNKGLELGRILWINDLS
jgi:hypothetical protein